MGLEAKRNSAEVSASQAGASDEIPDRQLIRQQLARILSSQEFLASDRAKRFLRYVVEETLDSRADRIKAYSVALAVFDRAESFDPQTDPIVRIEAGRLRRALERYYLVSGPSDPVRIEIPKGTYVPRFAWQNRRPATSTNSPPNEGATSSTGSTTMHPQPEISQQARSRIVVASVAAFILLTVLAAWTFLHWGDAPSSFYRGPALPQPAIAVLPFAQFRDQGHAEALSRGMTSELVRTLSNYSTLFVLDPQSLRRFGASPDVTAVGEETGVGFVLSGSVEHVGERIRIAVQVNDARSGGVVWAESYERELVVERIFRLQAEIAQEVMRRIAQPQGAIALFDWKRTRGEAPETWDAYECVVQAGELRRRVSPPQRMPEVRSCLRRVIQEEPGYGDAWMMHALIEIDRLRFMPKALLSRQDVEAAYDAAERAVELAPDSGRAHLALMMALYIQNDVERALAAGETAVRLSPHDPDILGEVGLRNIVAGDLHAGVALVNRATELYRPIPVATHLARSLAAFREGRYQDASDAVKGEEDLSNFIYWCLITAFHGRAGELERAKDAAEQLLKLYPDFAEWAWAEMNARNLLPEIKTALVSGWRRAGLQVPMSEPKPAR